MERSPEEREQRKQQSQETLRRIFRVHEPQRKKSVEEMLQEASLELGVKVELKKP